MNENSTIIGDAGLLETLSEEEIAVVREKLMRLLMRRTALYTGGDSGSVRVETAQELMKSIIFCLELYFKHCGRSMKLLVRSDPEELFTSAQAFCEKETLRGKKLWSEACRSAADFGSVSYRDTLSSIGGFFRRYDIRFFAHRIPCNIDYQLCRPVPEGLCGVEFVNEYLRRLITENAFVGRFESARAGRLLESFCPDYRELLINVYEPVLANAVGLTLLGRAAGRLSISARELDGLSSYFAALTATPAKKALRGAAEDACRELGIKGPEALRYAGDAAESLFPRIEAALPHGGLGGVFTFFERPDDRHRGGT